MNALHTFEWELQKLGYKSEALIRDYDFVDVLSSGEENRRVDLAAFTHVPESYRSAAFGVITGELNETAIVERRALGAPILFAIDDSQVGVWRVGALDAPRLLECVSLETLPDLFARNRLTWRPKAVHRAKSLYQSQPEYQLDFVDLGLIPAIEREVEEKLDRLLQQVIGVLLQDLDDEWEERAFRTTFRLLAAKILLDRGHPDALSWEKAAVDTVLAGIEDYYNLGQFTSAVSADVPQESIAAAWKMLREAISFRNISSDSLAFVYENTLVTADTRKRFGTHSTPRQVAEYVLRRLDLGRFDLKELEVFEPFTGAGTFLVAILRHVRDLLPDTLNGEQRHAFLVSRIRGAEIDSFACEVAALSLILADYPNANGWEIRSNDLFQDAELARAVTGARVILCNPPWENFDTDERAEYPEMTAKSVSKPIAVLQTALEARPEALGFVLPQGFLKQSRYAVLRQQVADTYGKVELTSLPDRVFQRAGFEASVLVASELRSGAGKGPTRLCSTVVEDWDRAAFLTTGNFSREHRREKEVTGGDLWIGVLDELWEFLQDHPRLGGVADVYRGLQWFNQQEGYSTAPKDGFKPGVFAPRRSLFQFEITSSTYLDMNPESVLLPGPLTRRWDKPKVLANVARMSRGPWRMAAGFDSTGLVASQGFFGIWSRDPNMPLEAIEGILNGPVANAFLTEHGSNQHFTNRLVKQLPLPKRGSLEHVARAVRSYREARRSSHGFSLNPGGSDERKNMFLVEVDAEVLKAYDLPPRLERKLLEFFRGQERTRRVGHEFGGWIPEEFTAYMRLHEYLGPLTAKNRGPWALEAFTPAPEEEVMKLNKFVR